MMQNQTWVIDTAGPDEGDGVSDFPFSERLVSLAPTLLLTVSLLLLLLPLRELVTWVSSRWLDIGRCAGVEGGGMSFCKWECARQSCYAAA